MVIFVPQLPLQKERTKCSARSTTAIFMTPYVQLLLAGSMIDLKLPRFFVLAC